MSVVTRRFDMSQRAARKHFLLFAHDLYRNDPLWVPPRFSQQMRTIDPGTGEFFQHGSAIFFGAYEGRRLVGTVCAAVDDYKNQTAGISDCVFGFLEFEDKQEVFDALMSRVENFAREHQLDRLIGPYHLDYENAYGITVEGEDRLPAMLCGHNKPYYRRYLESYGFLSQRARNLAFELVLNREDAQMQQLLRLGSRMAERSNIIVRPANFADFDNEVERIYYLINTSLAHLPDFRPWNREDLRKTLQDFRSFADPELILFAELPEGSPLSRTGSRPVFGGREPVGWLPGIPNLNEILVHAGGLRTPFQWLKFLAKLQKRRESLTIKSVLVPPAYWQKGVSIAMFSRLFDEAMKRGYSWIDMSLTAENNPYTPALARRMGAEIYRAYQVYTRPARWKAG